jgi:hypothetical protein
MRVLQKMKMDYDRKWNMSVRKFYVFIWDGIEMDVENIDELYEGN